MRKCVIIGASSFIGAYTVQAFLDAGYEVVGTGRNPRFAEYYRQKGVDYVHYDLSEKEACECLPSDADVVVHLAGRLPANSTYNLKDEDDAADYIVENVLGVAWLLEWCRFNCVERVISTVSYADVQNKWDCGMPVKEDWPRDFKFSGDHAAYVISKNAACDLLRYYNEQHGMKNVVFRLPPVYGVGPHESLRVDGKLRRSGIGSFIDSARQGLDISVFGNADLGRDIVYVKDVARAFVLAAGSSDAHGLYNIGTGQAVSLKEQAETIARVFGGEGAVSKVGVDPSRSNGITPYVFDIDKARTDFNYQPLFASFESQMLDWKQEEERGVYPALFSGDE